MSRVDSGLLQLAHQERAAAITRADRAELRVKALEGELAVAQAAAEARAPTARIAELEKGVLAAVRLADHLDHPVQCPGGELCECGVLALTRFLIDLRRGTERAVPGLPEDVDSAIDSLESLLAEERVRANAAELRVTALERELGACQEAARELAFAYMRDERPPPRAVAYGTSIPAPAPSLPPADATHGEG